MKSRGLTLYGKVLIIKSLGLSNLIYSISNVNVPKKRIGQDYYNLLLVKKHQSPHTGPERWKRDISIDTENWTDVFKMASRICKENKLKEFQFKFIHRIVITKKEPFRYGINTITAFTAVSQIP